MPLVIRRATLDDVAIIVDFNCRLAEESEGKSLDVNLLTKGVTAIFTDPQKGPYFLAVDDGIVVGQMQVTFEWSDWRNGWFWWIQSVYVRADYRRRGVFRALYDHVRKAAAATPDVVGLRLYVERDNRRAQETYVKLGMEFTNYLMLERYPLA